MNLKMFAEEVHECAKDHGWWDEARTDAEIVALIHSEWSEALEAYRNNEPPVWHICELYGGRCYPNQNGVIHEDTGELFCYHCDYWREAGVCERNMHGKPEGIAVELCDGCIRLLDAAAAWGIAEELRDDYHIDKIYFGIPLPELVARLHRETAYMTTGLSGMGHVINVGDYINWQITLVFGWLRQRGVDPEEVITEKHAYNLTRPYRHGGKKI